MHDLLTCPIVPIIRGGDGGSATLPALYAGLVGDAVDFFPGLAAHQAQAWYQFLAQLGAVALHDEDREALPTEADEWHGLIAALTPECAATAWSLAVSDPTKPAFLQPPTTRIGDFKECAHTPDMLDVPVTAKNHDRKQAQATGSVPHHWLYALLTLQTAQGYSGRGNLGIARMNGGLSSRVLVDRRPGPRWGPRVCRAIRMLLARREGVLRRAGDSLFRSRGGLALTWLKPWDDDGQIGLGELDPYFIEVCRRIRLDIDRDGGLRAVGRPSNRTRVDAQALKGNLADPWVPVDRTREGAPALTVGAGGFDYRLAQRILLQRGELRPPLALKCLGGEESRDSEIHMAVLVRGQGKTEGLHERTIPLPCSIAAQLATESDPDDDDDPVPLAALSKEMVDRAGQVRKVLRQAVLVYLQGPENPDFQSKSADPITARYDRAIDERFFDSLFYTETTERGFEAAKKDWQKILRKRAEDLAREVWAMAAAAPGARREKARAASEAVFYGGLRKRLPDAFPSSRDTQEDTA